MSIDAVREAIIVRLLTDIKEKMSFDPSLGFNGVAMQSFKVAMYGAFEAGRKSGTWNSSYEQKMRSETT